MEIINQVDKSWSKDYIIRYLYIKLAPFFERDLGYFLASEEEKYEQYQKGFIKNGRHIVCSTFVDFYLSLFQRFGIKAMKIVANSAKIPLFAMVVEGDKGPFYLDPLGDLVNNQYGLKTTEFGVIPRYQTLNKNYPDLIKLSPTYLNQIDKNLQLYPNNMPLNDYFFLIHEEMTNRNTVSKHFGIAKNNLGELFVARMDFANQHLINLGHVPGPYERLKLYLYLENQLFFGFEKKNITIKVDTESPCYRRLIDYCLKDKVTDKVIYHAGFVEEQKEDKTFALKRRI